MFDVSQKTTENYSFLPVGIFKSLQEYEKGNKQDGIDSIARDKGYRIAVIQRQSFQTLFSGNDSICVPYLYAQ